MSNDYPLSCAHSGAERVGGGCSHQRGLQPALPLTHPQQALRASRLQELEPCKGQVHLQRYRNTNTNSKYMSYKYKHKYQVQLLQTNPPAGPGTSRRRTSISGARSRSRCCQRPAAPADHQGWFSKNILQGSEIGIVAQIKIFFKGILYESCVDYCQQKATASKNSNSIEFTNILSQVFSF